MDRSLAVERLLRDVPPHELPAALRSALGEHFGALAVELLLADYALTELCQVGREPYTTEPIPVEGTTPGEAFLSQAAAFSHDGERVTGYLPISVRGDRLGVLAVTLPREPEPPVWAELERFAEAVAHELFVADRDTDLYIQARRSSRLTLAAEMQWQLLPGRACTRAEFALGGQLEPAYAIYGDCFDWSASARKLAVTLINGMGEGSEAALLTNLAVNALRNARRAGIALDAQAELADQAVYAHYRGAEHVAALLLEFDLATGAVSVVDAGSPRLWRQRDAKVERVFFDEQLPLGTFDGTVYESEGFQAIEGDRYVFVSDGVYNALGPHGEHYGDRELAEAVAATADLPAAHVPGAVLRELTRRRRGGQAEDDAMVVCLDWFGPTPQAGPDAPPSVTVRRAD
ncbi:PP2C family protein-serine/threonine phosphatase [Amycolatopsis mongoliensis]|uniref:PP2C family protein-serine/threonine phosphatase n=1 Tax=Amycolatopsis mongoliensis TaxID=715475 RepID=A0A9Y2JI28_9PSEU|nr:PP2C family protein-serine/threonine phosphatase [Amycolatopsis sp. 4-36]WIX99020.1 PP2C family protein-serine/threonine phosphatase [Amycolatopsis sp. 4-36]